jgi:hypothetical protein
MTPEDEEFESIAKRQAKEQAEKSFGDGDCDSPSWCKYYGKCHRKTVRAPMLANCIDTAEKHEPVAWLEPEWGEKICPEVGYEVTMTDDHPRDLGWTPIYAHPLQNTNETDEEIKAKCPRTDSMWSLGWYEGYKACNKNTAHAYLKGFGEGCKSMSARNGDTTGRWSGKTENIGSLGMPVNVPVTPPQREWFGLTVEEMLEIWEEHMRTRK